jgi:hypothetical protein
MTWPLGAAVVVVASAAGAGCGVFRPLCPPVDLWACGLWSWSARILDKPRTGISLYYLPFLAVQSQGLSSSLLSQSTVSCGTHVNETHQQGTVAVTSPFSICAASSVLHLLWALVAMLLAWTYSSSVQCTHLLVVGGIRGISSSRLALLGGTQLPIPDPSAMCVSILTCIPQLTASPCCLLLRHTFDSDHIHQLHDFSPTLLCGRTY